MHCAAATVNAIETEKPPASSKQEHSSSTPPESEPEVTIEPVHRYVLVWLFNIW